MGDQVIWGSISLTMATPPPEHVVYTSFCLPDSFARPPLWVEPLSTIIYPKDDCFNSRVIVVDFG